MSKRSEKKRGYISPELILSYLIHGTEAEKVHELIENPDYEVISSMYAMYEAVACVNSKDKFDVDNLLNLIKHMKISTDIEEGLIDQPYNGISKERIKILRARALQ